MDVSIEIDSENTCRDRDGDLKEDSKMIHLKVLDPDGSITNFKVTKVTPLIRVMNMYCKRRGYADGELRFRFDGDPIADETPMSMGMVNGDLIETFKFQMSG